MINVAYREFKKKGDTSWTIGTVSDAPGAAYLWHYWIPIMLLLNREQFRLCGLDEVLADTSPFLYPVELRWEFLEWLEEELITEFLTPHIPTEVLEAVQGGRAPSLFFSVMKDAVFHTPLNSTVKHIPSMIDFWISYRKIIYRRDLYGS